MPPYLDTMLVKLTGLLRNGQKIVQEGALTATASVADCSKSHFAKYYSEVKGPKLFLGVHSCLFSLLQLAFQASLPWSQWKITQDQYMSCSQRRGTKFQGHCNNNTRFSEILPCLQVMPLLRQILTQANDKTHNMMRAKALECISLIGMSIGRERFRNDAHQVLQYMQSLQVNLTEPFLGKPNSV